MSELFDNLAEAIKRNKKEAKKANKEFLENLNFYLSQKSDHNNPVDLNGRDLYHGAGED